MRGMGNVRLLDDSRIKTKHYLPKIVPEKFAETVNRMVRYHQPVRISH